jgi:hypothetical protein
MFTVAFVTSACQEARQGSSAAFMRGPYSGDTFSDVETPNASAVCTFDFAADHELLSTD